MLASWLLITPLLVSQAPSREHLMCGDAAAPLVALADASRAARLSADGQLAVSSTRTAGFVFDGLEGATDAWARVDTGTVTLACGRIEAHAAYAWPRGAPRAGLLRLRIFDVLPEGTAEGRAFDGAARARRRALHEAWIGAEAAAVSAPFTAALGGRAAALTAPLPAAERARVLAEVRTATAAHARRLAELGADCGRARTRWQVELCERVADEAARLRAFDAELRKCAATPCDAKLRAALAPPAATPDGYCKDTLPRLRWLEDATLPRTWVSLSLPNFEHQHVLAVELDAGELRPREAPTDRRTAVLVLAVPTGERVRVEARTGAALHDPPAQVIARFLTVALKRGAGAVLAADVPSVACGDTGVALDAEVPAAARFTTHAQLLPELERDHETTVRVCRGEACDAKSEASRVALRTPSPRYLALLAELSMSAGDLSTYAYREVGGSGGPDQLFALHEEVDHVRRASLALMLAGVWRPFMVAVGPSLLLGTGGGAFAQWNLRVGVALGDTGLFLTAGASLRQVARPIDELEVGRVVSVPRGASAPAAPAVRTHNVVVPLGSLGLALDLAVLGEAGEALLEALGGGS